MAKCLLCVLSLLVAPATTQECEDDKVSMLQMKKDSDGKQTAAHLKVGAAKPYHVQRLSLSPADDGDEVHVSLLHARGDGPGVVMFCAVDDAGVAEEVASDFMAQDSCGVVDVVPESGDVECQGRLCTPESMHRGQCIEIASDRDICQALENPSSTVLTGDGATITSLHGDAASLKASSSGDRTVMLVQVDRPLQDSHAEKTLAAMELHTSKMSGSVSYLFHGKGAASARKWFYGAPVFWMYIPNFNPNQIQGVSGATASTNSGTQATNSGTQATGGGDSTASTNSGTYGYHDHYYQPAETTDEDFIPPSYGGGGGEAPSTY